MKKEFFEELKTRIQPYFEETGCHDFNHTEKVYKNALKISEGENVDLDIVRASALLHDIARLKEENCKIKCHAETGAKMAEEILKQMNFPEEKIQNTIHCIKVHRYSKKLEPEIREAEVLQDADRLDALGTMAVARVFSMAGATKQKLYDPKISPRDYYDGSASTSINHFYEKILKIKPETFKTKTAQKIARERYNFVKEFVDRFIEEWNGEI